MKPEGYRVDAVLPSGGRICAALAAELGVETKALIPVGRRTMLECAIDALRETDRVDRIVVLGGPDVAEHPAARRADAVLPDAGGGTENVFRGLAWLAQNGGGRGRRAIVSATDLPFLTGETVCDFLDRCPAEAAVCAPLVRASDFMERFPDSVNEFVRLRDGEWTLGGLFLVDPAALESAMPVIERVFAARKSQVALARLLGPVFIARFLARRLTVAHVAQRCEQILGLRMAAVAGCAPETAFDVDEPVDYRYAVRAASAEAVAV